MDTTPADTTVIVGGARTPVGKFLGSLSAFSAAELGAIAIRGALDRVGLVPDAVDYVAMGQVLTAGTGQVPARQAATAAGIPMSTPAVTVDKVCLSGMEAVMMADLLLRSGLATVAVAGGQESMSRAPYLLNGTRAGHMFGSNVLHDHIEIDGLRDSATDQAMGALTDERNRSEENFSREDQDNFARSSHQRAAAARDASRFNDEITPIVDRSGRGKAIVIDRDEGIRWDTTADTLSRLRPAFAPSGTITAGNASQLSDGACAMVLMSKSHARELGLSWIAEIVDHGLVAGPDSTLQSQPARAIARACDRLQLLPRDLGVIEINEAFAAVGVASTRELGLDPDVVNVDGGGQGQAIVLRSAGQR